MSIVIKFFFLFLLFLLVESSTAKNLAGLSGPLTLAGRLTLGRLPLRELDESEINYFDRFIRKMKEMQREADEKYPLWKSTNYLDRSLFLLKKAQAYVQLWYIRRKYRNMRNPYGDLRNNVQGDLWPVHYDYCRQSEGTNLLTYMMYNYCRQSEGTNLLKYITYGLSPEADMV